MLLSIQSVDFYILDFLQTMARSPFWDKFFTLFTSFGDPVMIVGYCAILIVLQKTRKDGIMVLCGCLTGLAIGNGLLKLLIRRDKTDLSAAGGYIGLPKNFKNYLSFIENYLNTKINVISVGPDRKETIFIE